MQIYIDLLIQQTFVTLMIRLKPYYLFIFKYLTKDQIQVIYFPTLLEYRAFNLFIFFFFL